MNGKQLTPGQVSLIESFGEAQSKLTNFGIFLSNTSFGRVLELFLVSNNGITSCLVERTTNLEYWIGDNHVFRFNNPEEVRKQRDRATAKSNMHLSVTARDLEQNSENSTRPDSPTSSTDEQFDVDWNFAKREAALARLGLDPSLDNLPDDDLNKLYEKITKVKTMRDHTKSRPESSMSQVDDVWSETSRPLMSEANTDDTSLYAMPGHVGNPAVDGSLKDTRNAIGNLVEEVDGDAADAEDLRMEKEHMEQQLRVVKSQMKRLIDARARGDLDALAIDFEPIVFSARQLRLIRKVLDRWRAHRAFSMAEKILTNAVVIKEANVMRYVQLNQGVLFHRPTLCSAKN